MIHTQASRAALHEQIVAVAKDSGYDHRKFLHQSIAERFPHMLEDLHLQYGRFKYAIARVLQPRTIYEVGIGYGISARAFLEGCPHADYFGIDNLVMGVHPNEALNNDPRSIRYQIVDSVDLAAFYHPRGPIDLLHIDGGHLLGPELNDIVKGLQARPEWLLIDDCANASVAAAAYIALYRHFVPELRVLYFEDSCTGQMLVHVQRDAPQMRKLEIECDEN